MNTNSKDTATKVWRWNVNGLGYSKSDTPGEAYDGEYGLAMTMDGAIVADYITTGIMSANLIRGGTLIVGGSDGRNGLIQVKNDNGQVVCTLDKNGADILGTIKAKNNAGYWVEVSDGKISAGGTENGQEAEYVSMDGTGSVTDTGTGTTYKGLRISAPSVSIDTTLLCTKKQGEPNNSYRTGTTCSLNVSYFSQFDPVTESITVATPDGGSAKIDYISAINYKLNTATDIQFKNGLLVTNIDQS